MIILRNKELTQILTNLDEIKELTKSLDKNEAELTLQCKIGLCVFSIQRKLLGDG